MQGEVTSTHACVRVWPSSWTLATEERRFARGGGFADRQILTAVNLRLPIPVTQRGSEMERFWFRVPRDSRSAVSG